MSETAEKVTAPAPERMDGIPLFPNDLQTGFHPKRPVTFWVIVEGRFHGKAPDGVKSTTFNRTAQEYLTRPTGYGSVRETEGSVRRMGYRATPREALACWVYNRAKQVRKAEMVLENAQQLWTVAAEYARSCGYDPDALVRAEEEKEQAIRK